METLLAIDIGTSSTKAALYTTQGELLAFHQQGYPLARPHPGWAEQNPFHWWEAVCSCSRAVLGESGNPPVAAVALSGQTPSLVALDKTGQPLRPAILWLDRRSYAQVDWLHEHLGAEKAIQKTGNLLNSYYGGVKWLWYRQAEPENYAHTWKITQASSFIHYTLTGEVALDYSQAGLCSPCFNINTRAWDPEVCELMGIAVEKLPKLIPSTHIVGTVTPEAAQLSAIPEGTPVAVGGGDFALSCLGAGVLGRGGAVAMLGTAGNLLVPGPASTDPRLINTVHVTGETLSLGGVMAGGLVNWTRDLFNLDDMEVFTYLEAEAAYTPPGAEGLVFTPYLMGERTPIWDPNARGMFFGLSTLHGRGHLYRAVLEGVAYAFRQMLGIIEGTGTQIGTVTLTDGGARSPLWRQIFADVLGLPVRWQPGSGGTMLGTACLAGVASGLLSGFEELDRWLGPVHHHQPDPAFKDVYDRNYTVFKQLYDRVKDLYPILHAVL